MHLHVTVIGNHVSTNRRPRYESKLLILSILRLADLSAAEDKKCRQADFSFFSRNKPLFGGCSYISACRSTIYSSRAGHGRSPYHLKPS